MHDIFDDSVDCDVGVFEKYKKKRKKSPLKKYKMAKLKMLLA
jgi:hypothetical protein